MRTNGAGRAVAMRRFPEVRDAIARLGTIDPAVMASVPASGLSPISSTTGRCAHFAQGGERVRRDSAASRRPRGISSKWSEGTGCTP